MEIHYSKLEGKAVSPDKAFVLSGAEDRPKNGILEKIRAAALRDSSGFDEETFEGKGASASAILGAAQTIPFEAPYRLVIVRDAQRLALEEAQVLAEAMGYEVKKPRGAKGGKKAKGEETKPVPRESLADYACLVLVCREEALEDADQARKLKAVSGLLEAAAKECATLISFPELKGEEAGRRLRQAAEEAGKKLTPDGARHLLALVDGDYSLAAAELEKAILYVEPRPEISEHDLDQVVTPSRSARIFSLVDAIAEGRLGEALSQLKLMLGGTERPEAVAMRHVLPLLSRQFRLLWQTRALLDRKYPLSRTQNPPAEIAGLLPDDPNLLSLLARQPYFEARFKKQAARFSQDQLREALRLFMETDCALKGLSPSLNAGDTLERLVVNLCQLASSSGSGVGSTSRSPGPAYSRLS